MRRLVPLALAALLALGALPATAVPVPVLASDNVELLASLPDVAAISATFSPDSPHMYLSTLRGITIYDISNPALPRPVSEVPFVYWQNEAVDLGMRVVGGKTVKFLLVGLDGLYAVSPTDANKKASTSGKELVIVDVTDPANPALRGRIVTKTSTHTVSCATETCEYVYTSGAYDPNFSIVDITNLDKPVEIKQVKSPAGSGHDWDQDEAGIQWHVGFKGIGAFDVSDPRNPVALASADKNGLDTDPSHYNNFLLHNSIRPNALAFSDEVRDADGNLVKLDSGPPSLDRGNVLLVTEEDYLDPTCQGGEGSFSTWHVPYLDAAKHASIPNAMAGGKGAITPLDSWNTELLATGQDTIAGALCSAHYFDYHQSGFVAQAWYQQGTRILDVRNPRDIKQVGYLFTGASETWSSYWVPQYVDGKMTDTRTNIVYSADARGLDILRVTLPATAPADTTPVVAPILPQWRAGDVAASAPSERFGFLCRLSATP